MIRTLLMVLKDYGLDSIQLAIISYFGWKLMTNHLAHIQASVDAIVKKMDIYEKDQKEVSERIAHVEGKLS